MTRLNLFWFNWCRKLCSGTTCPIVFTHYNSRIAGIYSMIPMSHEFLNIQENSFYCLHFRCKQWQQDAISRMFRNKKNIVKSASSCCCCRLHLAAAETCSFKWNYTIIQFSICKQLLWNKLEVLECCNNRKQWNCFQGLSAVEAACRSL